jgi:chemotaxis protein methyltransferase WspC
MALPEIEALLQQVMGLNAETIGSSSVARAVQGRMTACGVVDAYAYYELVTASPRELQELIESVIVPETWFFRDPEAFVELKRIACEEWQPNRTGDVVKILSLACATGEEPYSIAMALLDAGLSSDRFRIDAIDISERSLDHARRGVYGTNSFRGDDLAFRGRYFQRIADGHRVHDAVREPVRFQYGNVHAEDFLVDALPYDAVFCRNLLIYFDQPTQTSAIAVLQRLLKDTGVLFVGPAETVSLLNRDFVSAKVPLAFAFRRALLEDAPWPRPTFPPIPGLPGIAKPMTTLAVRAPQKPERARVEARSSQPKNGIAEAFALADQGRLVEAAALCEEQMREHGPSAQAFYLMGLICSADGRLYAADRCYRKALYLDENHVDAMMHLAVLLEEQGDKRGAKRLRARAQSSGGDE